MQMLAVGDVPRTMMEVVKAADLGSATVFRHFPDLGLLAADIEQPKHDAMVATSRATDGIHDVLVALRRVLSNERD
jgi:AcrR family transcriptional regulator